MARYIYHRFFLSFEIQVSQIKPIIPHIFTLIQSFLYLIDIMNPNEDNTMIFASEDISTVFEAVL